MGLILARSPFFINRSGLDDDATFTFTLRYRDGSGTLVNIENYTLAFRLEQNIDISPFIRDFLDVYEIINVRVVINGSISGIPQTPIVDEYFAVDGYGYYEEGYNKDFESYLRNDVAFYAGSNKTIYRNRKEALNIPLLNPSSAVGANNGTFINYYQGNELIYTDNTDFGYGFNTLDYLVTEDRVQYISLDEFPSSFQDRVVSDGGVVESENCSDSYDNLYSEKTPDRVVIVPYNDQSASYEINIVPVTECKYTPHRLVFRNKFGVREDMWFFKKSTNEITTSRESYRANNKSSYISGDLSKHSYASYNVNGRESLSLNTGFVPESFNENIRQLMLSEQVWITVDNQRIPVTIKNSQKLLKKSINEKLINYEIDVEFAFDAINTIG